jgi:ribosomal protein L11 methyltransferase
MQALVVSVGREQVEIAADELWSLGVVAIEERALVDGETIELWTSLGDDIAAVGAALESLRWAWRFEEVDEAVSDTWRQHAEPTWVANNLVIYPSWLPAPELGDALAIGIEPGATFGMGDHPTTVLSMRALRDVVRVGARVLDVGCGSGVLAIAACLFGAEHADAIDISPASVPTTSRNAEWNGVADRVAVSTTPLAEMDGTYDVVVANILAPTLIDLADDLQRSLAPTGVLIISGILAERHQHVLDALAPLVAIGHSDLDGWTAITLAHRSLSG